MSVRFRDSVTYVERATARSRPVEPVNTHSGNPTRVASLPGNAPSGSLKARRRSPRIGLRPFRGFRPYLVR